MLRLECEACQNTGRRYENGQVVRPFQHCRACVGLSSLQPPGDEPDDEREAVSPVDPPIKARPSPRKRPSFRRPWE